MVALSLDLLGGPVIRVSTSVRCFQVVSDARLRTIFYNIWKEA